MRQNKMEARASPRGVPPPGAAIAPETSGHEIVPSDFTSKPRAISSCEARPASETCAQRSSHIGPRLGGRDDGEQLARPYVCGSPPKPRLRILHQPRIDVEFDDVALGVALEALMEHEVPAVAETQDPERPLSEVAGDLLRDRTRTCSTICSGRRTCGAISATASRMRLRLRIEIRSPSSSFSIACSPE